MRRHLLAGLVVLVARAEDLPRGQIIADVKCGGDASQSYALYLPSNYSEDRAWSVILAFDPGDFLSCAVHHSGESHRVRIGEPADLVLHERVLRHFA